MTVMTGARENMTDRYIVKWSVGPDPYPPEPFSTEGESLGRAAELFAVHGQKLHVEIYLNDGLYLGFGTLNKWHKGLLSLG
jgi:hypothetical protein